jgi:uncharacterized protein (DUF952 family)
MTTIYKVLSADAWDEAQRAGSFTGSAVDLQDGFIHFSKAEQLRETLRRHFAGVRGLVLLYVPDDAIVPASALRWEASRGGALFPHLYAPLPTAAVQRVEAITLDANGLHVLPELELL